MNKLPVPKIFFGVVEDNKDPLMIGRVRVRIYGIHSGNQGDIPTEDLPWAVSIAGNQGQITGINSNQTLNQGMHVVGFTFDELASQPIVLGVLHGTFDKVPDSEAFKDLDGIFPLADYVQESDLNRLARNEKIDQTIVQQKKDSLAKEVKSANEQQWDEPESPYNAQYPHNRVIATKNGHIIEIDDTEGAERIHVYHKSGTSIEMFTDGDLVKRTTKDDYQIVQGNLNLKVDGQVNITVQGDANIKAANIWAESDSTTITSPKIDLGGDSDERLVLGDTFKKFFNKFLSSEYAAHTHPTPTGMSGAPVQPATQMADDTLSDVSKTKKS